MPKLSYPLCYLRLGVLASIIGLALLNGIPWRWNRSG